MKSMLETLIFNSPIWVQNLALSIYGLKAQYIRYGGNYKQYYNQVSSHLKFTRSEINVYIESTLIKTVISAVENVPYYMELFEREKIPLNKIRSIEDLKIIPLLEKEEVRSAPLTFINKNFNINSLLVIHTTGTTGTPLKIYSNAETRQRNFAFYNRFLKQVSIAFKHKRATFGGRTVVPAKQITPPFWRYSFFQKNLLFSSYHLTDDNIPFYIQQLKKFKPDYIDSYPSSLFCIASYAGSHNIDLKGIVKNITTSAETLFPEQRKVIETTFGVPVFDQYGAAEMCVFVGQCIEGNYHIHSDYGVIEFLREDGSNAKPGEEAEVVCTSFINPIMPLIRYRIGDRGIFSDRQCKCGSIFPIMEKILGRKDDVIITPDDKKIGRLSPVMKGFPVKEMQFVQKIKSEVDVFIVKGVGYQSKTEFELIEKLRDRLGYAIKINIIYMNKINRGKGGKLKSIISYIS